MNPSVLDHYIDGAFVTSDETFLKRSPVNGAVTALCSEGTRQHVEMAVLAARAAFELRWQSSTPATRSFVLHRFANVMQSRADDLAAAVAADTGCSIAQARTIEVSRSIAHLRHFADLITTQQDRAAFLHVQEGEGAQSFTRHHPLGVVGILSPATLPLFWATAKLAAALAAGNTVVLKPSEHTPATGAALAHVAHESGCPAGIFNVVLGLGANATGHALAIHPLAGMIALVGAGSTADVLQRGRDPGLRGKRLASDTGGRNVAVVFDDADFGKALAGVFKAAFFNAGQTCFSVSEVFVQRSMFDRFLTMLRGAASRVQLVPMISPKHRAAAAEYVRRTVEGGARVYFGGQPPRYGDQRDNGAFYLPTVLAQVPDAERTRDEDVFGPVCHVMPFDTEDDIIAQVSRRPCVSCSVWSEGLSRVHRVAPRLQASMVWVNAWLLSDVRMPLSGNEPLSTRADVGTGLEPYSSRTTVTIKI